MVALDMGGCPNRCRHCWLGHSQNRKMDKNELYFVSNEFHKITKNLEIYSWYREPDFLDNYKELHEIENKLSDCKSVSHFELLSYWRAVRDDKYIPWLKELGVKACQLTLWGGKEKTDYYVGRKGAFDEIIKTIEILLNNQIAPRIQIFVNKDNVKELIKIEDIIYTLGIVEKCNKNGMKFSVFVHQGSCEGENMKNYPVWITEEDFKYIPKMIMERTLEHFNKNDIKDIFGVSENILYEKLISNNEKVNYVSNNPVFYVDCNFNVYPNITNTFNHWKLGNLKEDKIENIIEKYVNNDSFAQNASITVSICDLVIEFGESESNNSTNSTNGITSCLPSLYALNFPMYLSDVIIVLSRPAEAGNVGAVCRAMKNMGLSRLRLVAPEFPERPDIPELSEAGLGYGGSEAIVRARAIHAADVWEKAETFDSLSAAIKDCGLVIGTTRRRGRRRKQISVTPVEAAAFLKDRPGKAALVFGSERTGLEDSELELCNMASHIPADLSFPSLNLSHAVQIYAYELFRVMAPQSEAVKGRWVPQDQETTEALVAEIMDNLKILGFYKQRGREEQERFFRDIFSRAALTEREGRYFADIIAKAVRLAQKNPKN